MENISAESVSLNNEIPPFIALVNQQIAMLASIEHIGLGPQYSSMTHEQCQNNLALYRLSKKFEEPSSTGAKARREKTLSSVFIADENGLSSFEPALMDLDPLVRKALYETRLDIRNHAGRYAFDVGLVEITNGETFVSRRGDSSIYAKLKHASQWCVTPECFNLFARVVYGTRALKRMCKQHFVAKLRKYGPPDFLGARRLLNQYACVLKQKGHSKNSIGFLCFKKMLKFIVTFVGHSRFTTVPKNNEKDRVVMCEALGNMLVQRVIGVGIRKMIRAEFGLDLLTAQDLHGKLILDSRLATIDLRNASDSIFTCVIDFLLGGTKLHRHVMLARTSHIEYGEAQMHYLNMVAPMGNGFTFELMTFMLLTFARYFDKEASVYGDDIVINTEVAPLYIRTLQTLGMTTNESKTFVSGSFRESCGKFVSHSKYCVSYDFEWAADLFDAIILVNKLGLISLACSGAVRFELERVWNMLVKACPVSLLQGVHEHSEVELEHSVKIPCKRLLRMLRKHNKDQHELDVRIHRKTVRHVRKSLHCSDVSFGVRVERETAQYKRMPRRTSCMAWIGYFYYVTTLTPPAYRNSETTVLKQVCYYDEFTAFVEI